MVFNVIRGWSSALYFYSGRNACHDFVGGIISLFQRHLERSINKIYEFTSLK